MSEGSAGIWCRSWARRAGDEVDVQVLLGKRERLPVRLIARRVSPEQAERRRAKANRSMEGKAKGVQRPMCRKRRPADSKRQRPAQAEEDGQGAPAALGLDDPDHQRAAGVALDRRGAGAGALSLADRTVLETVEAGGQSGYVA